MEPPNVADQFIIIPNQLTSILDVVNLGIIAMGETPVNTIDPPPTADVDKMLLWINQQDKAVQGRGWGWNTEEDFPLTLDTDSKVPVPDQVLRITSAYREGCSFRFRVQDGFLYDRDKRTFTFQTAPVVDMIERLSWDSLPDAARMYIGLMALTRFLAAETERTIALNVNAQDLRSALVELEHYEDETNPRNGLYGNRTLVNAFVGQVSRRNVGFR